MSLNNSSIIGTFKYRKRKAKGMSHKGYAACMGGVDEQIIVAPTLEGLERLWAKSSSRPLDMGCVYRVCVFRARNCKAVKK